MITHLFIDRLSAPEPEERVVVVGPLVRAYLSPDINATSREEIGAALVNVLEDPNPMVRRALAEALGENAGAPRHLVRALAGDQLEVAAPVLLRSPVLRDYDLVELIGEGDERIQAIIASRRSVSAPVSAALIEVASARVCRFLLENSGAEIVAHCYGRLAERHAAIAEIRAALLERPDLPIDVRHHLTLSLCEALGDFDMVRSVVRPERARRMISDAWERATVELAVRCEGEDVRRLVVYLDGTEKLTVSLLLRALVDGSWDFFIAAMAHLSRLPERRVARLVGDRRGAGFRGLYKRAGLPPSIFEGFKVAVEAVRDARAEKADLRHPATRVAVLDRIVDAYEEIGADALDDLNGLFVRLLDEAARDQAKSVYWEEATAA